MSDFKIEFGAVPGLPGAVMVVLTGPVDAKSVPAFRAQMEALKQRRLRHVLFEMGEVRYINSTGLAYLITLSESIRERGGAVGLINVQPKVKLIFESMGLLGFVKFYASRAGAVRELQPPKPPVPAPPRTPAAPSVGAIRRLFRRLFGPPSERRV